MPETAPTRAARVPIQVRVGAAGLTWLDTLATEKGCSRSTALRASLAVAANHEREVAKAIEAAQ